MGSKEDTPDREIARSLFLTFSLCLSVSVVKLRIDHGLDSALRGSHVVRSHWISLSNEKGPRRGC